MGWFNDSKGNRSFKVVVEFLRYDFEMFSAACCRVHLYCYKQIENFVKADDGGIMGDVLCKVALYDLQQFFFACQSNLRLEKRPKQVGKVLIKQLGIRDGVLNVQDDLDCTLIEYILRNLADQIGN